MNTYGVLGRYIPAFGRIVGRMQYDLFHAYTVDAHTLFVLSNLRRLSLPKYDHELPQLSAIMQQLPKLEIAYLAALFHDIAKGRGGDHSQLGAVDAEAFCLEQGLSRYDARLVAWLVQNHLELSVTAQKQDISDPEVINAFARKVGDETHLDYLYVLTSADVRGTNPKLWNSWKASLFQEFYERVKRALRRGLESPIDPGRADARDAGRRAQAAGRQRPHHRAGDHARLGTPDGAPTSCATRRRKWPGTRSCWPIANPAAKIRWSRCSRAASAAPPPSSRSRRIATTASPSPPPCSISSASTSSMRASRRRATASASTSITCSKKTARRSPTANASARSNARCGARCSTRTMRRSRSRAACRARRACSAPPRRSRSRVDERNRRSVLELIAGDRPGLLCDVGKVLMEERIDLLAAKIMTVGERAEDVFYLASLAGQPLDEAAATRLQQRLSRALDRRAAA